MYRPTASRLLNLRPANTPNAIRASALMVAPTPMPADAPVLSPELSVVVEIAAGGDSVARPALTSFERGSYSI